MFSFWHHKLLPDMVYKVYIVIPRQANALIDQRNLDKVNDVGR